MARAYEHVRKQQAKMANKNKLRLSSKATRDDIYQGGDQANGIEADEIMLWEPQQRLSLEGTEGKDGQHKVPAKWTPKWTGPHRVIEKIKGKSKSYFIFHTGRSKKMKVSTNRMHRADKWSKELPSTSKFLDGQRGYELGGWCEIDELIILPLQTPYNFGVAKVTGVNTNGSILYQWYGNPTKQARDQYKPGWVRSARPNLYYQEKPKHNSHQPYFGHEDMPIHQRDVLLHGFELTQGSRLPKGVINALNLDIRVGGN